MVVLELAGRKRAQHPAGLEKRERREGRQSQLQLHKHINIPVVKANLNRLSVTCNQKNPGIHIHRNPLENTASNKEKRGNQSWDQEEYSTKKDLPVIEGWQIE